MPYPYLSVDISLKATLVFFLPSDLTSTFALLPLGLSLPWQRVVELLRLPTDELVRIVYDGMLQVSPSTVPYSPGPCKWRRIRHIHSPSPALPMPTQWYPQNPTGIVGPKFGRTMKEMRCFPDIHRPARANQMDAMFMAQMYQVLRALLEVTRPSLVFTLHMGRSS